MTAVGGAKTAIDETPSVATLCSTKTKPRNKYSDIYRDILNDFEIFSRKIFITDQSYQ